jgi:ABC-2 type transport system ATP-binding protein
MIELHNLTKQYGKMTALNNVSMKIKKGEILGLLGPNGAGKTTAMRIVTGYLPPTSGTVTIDGKLDILKDSLAIRKKIGYLPETVPLYEDLLVEESLSFYAQLNGIKKAAIGKAIDKVIKDCHIEDVRYKLIKTLSKGFRQRLGLAQALINDPEILILDEPTIGLDPKQIIEIRELIKSFSGKRTVICDRIAIIHKGELIAIDKEEKLLSSMTDYNLKLTIKGSSVKIIKELPQLNFISRVEKGVSPSEYLISTKTNDKNMKELLQFIIDKGWTLLKMEEVTGSLEDTFIRLVNQHERSN